MPWKLIRLSLAAALLAGCAQGPGSGPAPATVAASPPPAPVPFDQAVLNAGNAVFSTMAAGGVRRTLVIDPLVTA